jgi:hypothetical protein
MDNKDKTLFTKIKVEDDIYYNTKKNIEGKSYTINNHRNNSQDFKTMLLYENYGNGDITLKLQVKNEDMINLTSAMLSYCKDNLSEDQLKEVQNLLK